MGRRRDDVHSQLGGQEPTAAELAEQLRRVPGPTRLAEHLDAERDHPLGQLVDAVGGECEHVEQWRQHRERGPRQQLGAATRPDQPFDRGEPLEVAAQGELVQERPSGPLARDQIRTSDVARADDAGLLPQHLRQHLGGVAAVAVDRRIGARCRLEHGPTAEGVQVDTGPLAQRAEGQ